MIMIVSLVMIMPSLRNLFPLDHKNLMFMFMIMIMFMIVMSLVGIKPYKTCLTRAASNFILTSFRGFLVSQKGKSRS